MDVRVALVTGGGRGIGEAIAARLAVDGRRVAIAAHGRRQTCVQYSGRYHMLEDPVIVVGDDRTETHAYFLTLEGLSPVVIGTFDDEIVRTPKGLE